jgi:uncharacterized protein YdhG (YjbR/CyaY superfamily)
MDTAVQAYVDAIPSEHRPLFDRLHALVTATRPDAELVLAYKMPTFRVGKRRLFIGVWKHGISIYGWDHGRDGGFVERHPDLKTSTGTIRLRPEDALTIPDEEFHNLFTSALTDPP